MQSYFSKLKGSAVSLAKHILTETSGSNSSVNISNDPKENKAELLKLFHSITDSLDTISKLSDAHSVEAEKKLNHSKVRDHLESIIVILKIDLDNENALHRMGRDDRQDERTICIDTFIQNMMLQELCNRAIMDSPRGTMPIVLNSLANLLRIVDYPFLPLQSVHKPIGKLISIAARFDAIYSITRSSQDFDNYRKRSEIGLTALLSILWRKIAENPPILDYFTFADVFKRPVHPNDKTHETQMDMLSALIHLMVKPTVGPFAQEALLLALTINDPRVHHFLLHNTTFVHDLVGDLCGKFQIAFEASHAACAAAQNTHNRVLQSRPAAGRKTSMADAPAPLIIGTLTATFYLEQALSHTTIDNPVSPRSPSPSIASAGGTASPAPGSNSLYSLLSPTSTLLSPSFTSSSTTATADSTPRNNAASNTMEQAMEQGGEGTESVAEQFLKALNLCNAVALSLASSTSDRHRDRIALKERERERNSKIKPSPFDEFDDDEDKKAGNTSGRSSTNTDSDRDILSILIEEFILSFLQGTVKGALKNSGDQRSLAYTVLLRDILLALKRSERVDFGSSTSLAVDEEDEYEDEYTGDEVLSSLPWKETATATAAVHGRGGSRRKAPASLLQACTRFLCGHLPHLSAGVLNTPSGELAVDNTPLAAELFPPPDSDPSSNSNSNSNSNNISSSTPGEVDYSTVFASRVGSMSKPLSVSSCQLLSELIENLPLDAAIELVMRTSITPTSATNPAPPLSPSTSASTPLSTPTPQTGLSSSSSSARKAMESFALAFDYSEDMDAILYKHCKTIFDCMSKSIEEDLSGGSAASPQQGKGVPLGSAVPDESYTKTLKSYIDKASTGILNKLAGRISRIMYLHKRSGHMYSSAGIQSSSKPMEALSPEVQKRQSNRMALNSLRPLVSIANAKSGSTDSADSAGSVKSSFRGEKSAMLELIIRRLSLFLTLKIEEQVALSGLVQQVLLVICTLTVLPPSTSPMADLASKQQLHNLLELLKVIESLWVDVKTHLVKNVPDCRIKYLAMRHILQGGSRGRGFNSQSQKLVDRLTPPLRQLLESAVVLNDLQFEVRGFVFAIKLLRPGLRDSRGLSVSRKKTVVRETFADEEGGRGDEEEDEDELEEREEASCCTDVKEEFQEDRDSSAAWRSFLSKSGGNGDEATIAACNLLVKYQTEMYQSQSRQTERYGKELDEQDLEQPSSSRSSKISNSDSDCGTSVDVNMVKGPISEGSKPNSLPDSGGSTTGKKKMQFWCDLESKEKDFLSEYNGLERMIKAIISDNMRVI